MAKKVKINLKDLSTEELMEKVGEEKLRLQKLRFSHAVSPLENPNVLKRVRRDIARIHTELRARELSTQPVKG
ncbi:50S ribosomal protein L29 [Sphingobacteriales bacterium UPWRP_1]|nr:50S ribosomal protein L29 [Sphingobacteriales bacterium TSM_CSS]PSJ76839.1 50S ribosomal protein L29 [Sphingobacteriales bacterium UPWRP_1]